MNIGIIRCEKNEETCPLTGCLNCLQDTQEGFADYDENPRSWRTQTEHIYDNPYRSGTALK